MDNLSTFTSLLIQRVRHNWELLLLLAVALTQRLVLWVCYEPAYYSDTKSYYRLAEGILHGMDGYDGSRTPGYPLFLAFLGSGEQVWLVQTALGIAITLLFYYLGKELGRNAKFGLLVGLAHTLNLGQLFFEANLLTETLATFLVIYTVCATVRGMIQPQARTTLQLTALGYASTLALMTRAQFIYLPFWVLLFIIWAWQEELIPSQWRLAISSLLRIGWSSWRRIVFFLGPVAALTLSWVLYIYNIYGFLGLSTMSGYHLIQHTGVFFEYVPDEYADLRDIYLQYREDRVAEYGSQANAIWDAIPAMQEVSGQSFFDLSRTLTNISVRLIMDHPDLYLRNVIDGWWMFWRAPIYWLPDGLHWQFLVPWLKSVMLLERRILFAINMLFIIASVLAVISRRLRILWKLSASHWMIAGIIWICSIVQTILDHGDNPRFLLPVQSLVVFWVFWVIWVSLSAWMGSKRDWRLILKRGNH